MILVDTSVWIRHFRTPDPQLTRYLDEGLVRVHPFVMGELGCGTLSRRHEVLSLLRRLNAAGTASDAEVMRLIEAQRLMGRGLGWVDVHLLASCLIDGSRLWTLDRPLARQADGLGVGCSESSRCRDEIASARTGPRNDYQGGWAAATLRSRGPSQ